MIDYLKLNCTTDFEDAFASLVYPEKPFLPEVYIKPHEYEKSSLYYLVLGQAYLEYGSAIQKWENDVREYEAKVSDLHAAFKEYYFKNLLTNDMPNDVKNSVWTIVQNKIVDSQSSRAFYVAKKISAEIANMAFEAGRTFKAKGKVSAL
jgi:hypothetical protein